MPRSLVLALCCLAAVCSLGTAQQQQPAPITELPAFSAAQTCLPVNILVSPSDDLPSGAPAFGFQVEAEPAVSNAINASVSGGVLSVVTTTGFSTEQPVKVCAADLGQQPEERAAADPSLQRGREGRGTNPTALPTPLHFPSLLLLAHVQVVIYLPSTALAQLDHLGHLSSVYVSEGFATDTFTLVLGVGAGSAYVYNMSANTTRVQTSSSGEAVLTGAFGAADVAASGISTVFVSGVNGSVLVDLSGVSTLFLQPTTPSVSIAGRQAVCGWGGVVG